MPSHISAASGTPAPRTALVRILGLGFGLAVIFGGTVGVGILRLPGTIAGELRSFWLILAVWVAGGCYALMGANAVAELGAAMPQAGGFYVYSRRAFGPAAGFAVGWADWLSNCAVIAYASVTAAEYVASLLPALAAFQNVIAVALLAVFCAMQAVGLRLSSSVQKLTSSATAVTFVVLAVACFLHAPAAQPAAPLRSAGALALLVPLVAALRAIVVAYDGWYEAIYFTEEDENAEKNLPRAMFGGVLLVIGLYLLMNLAFLHVLPIPALAASPLPAADAARLVFPAWGSRLITVLSLLTLLSLINAVLLGAPRILLAIGRDGLFSQRIARVGRSGTPLTAMLLSAAAAAALILSGKFEDIIAVAAILVAALYSANYIAVIVLRLREPALPRPFRTWGYPVTTLLVLAGSLIFLAAAIHDDLSSALRAVVLLAVAAPVYLWKRWQQRAR